MKRPSKKEIREKIEKLRATNPHRPPGGPSSEPTGRPQPKKPNKNRIRKQGV